MIRASEEFVPELKEVPTITIGGFDVHRQPVTFDDINDQVGGLRADSCGTGETAAPRSGWLDHCGCLQPLGTPNWTP